MEEASCFCATQGKRLTHLNGRFNACGASQYGEMADELDCVKKKETWAPGAKALMRSVSSEHMENDCVDYEIRHHNM